jgi:hypothetical protein
MTRVSEGQRSTKANLATLAAWHGRCTDWESLAPLVGALLNFDLPMLACLASCSRCC